MGRNYKCGRCRDEYPAKSIKRVWKDLLKPYKAGEPQEGVAFEHGRDQPEYVERHICPNCGHTNSYFGASVHERRKPVVGVGFGPGG